MKKIRVAILGQGRSGRDIHGRCLSGMTDMYEIVATVDTLADRRERSRNEYGCETFEDYRSLLDRKDIDLVINALPSHLHVPVTLEFINAGFNIVCDKPLARKVSEVDTLIAAAEKSGKLFTVFQQSRYSPLFTKMREIINSGVLGRIVQINIRYNGFQRRWDWQTLQEFNGGSLLNTGPHPVDQALQLFGTDIIPEVKCFMDRVNTFGDAEDYVKLILSGPGRPVIDIEISSCSAFPQNTYEIYASNGGLKASGSKIEWKYFKPEEAPEQHLIKTPLSKEDGTPAYCSEKLIWYEESADLSEETRDTFKFMTTKFYTMIYRAMTEGAPLEITPQQVRQQIAVMEEAHRQNPLSRLDG